MASSITGIRIPAAAITSPQPAPRTGGGAEGFGAVLGEAISNVEGFSRAAEQSTGRFLSGETEELHRVMLDTQRAELSLNLFLQMRNKVVEAYQEVMRMQV